MAPPSLSAARRTSGPTCVAEPSRFWRDPSGAAALEFAILSVPFVFLIFAIIEFGLIMVMNVQLSQATAAQARLIRTGQLVAPGSSATTSNGAQMDRSDFKSAICSRIVLVPAQTCANQLKIDVSVLGSYQTSAPNPFNGKSFSSAQLCYFSGVPGQVVEMRAFYLWPVITPYILQGLVNVTSADGNSGSWNAITAAEIWRNEPNPSVSNTSATC